MYFFFNNNHIRVRLKKKVIFFFYRWKEAECILKVTITDQTKDEEIKNTLTRVVQLVFTRHMSDPKRKIVKSKLSKA